MDEPNYLGALFKVKRKLEGLLKGDYPASSEIIAYNQGVGDSHKEVMRLIHEHLNSQITKEAPLTNF